ncbi:MAG TPA: peptide ABC transporter substrate-binding protein [Gallionella sp.]|nr:MAG: peptide ABC transporter substrate-binding protein [Gallionellales bacterium GWA2_54_124]HCI51901.1 peptide ABC transporter substrate-binding protein [Gallionella sp.]
MKSLAGILLLLLLSACDEWNNPYPASEAGQSILYTAFTERPKHLDPAQAYSENEYEFISNIYAPPLQYHYLKRPYQLVPQAASLMPTVTYQDAQHRSLPDDAPADRIAYSVYEIHIKPGMRYQPHPAFARTHDGRLEYEHLTPADLRDVHVPGDFPHSGTRVVNAADYVNQIKRLANPQLHLPIFGVMSEYIVGLKAYADTLQQAVQMHPDAFLDLSVYPLPGAEVVDDTTYRITIHGKYPQFAYWLAMPFFAPMPPEAERFYAQPGMRERNLSLDWWPVGSGPYFLSENNPNRRMVLTKNPYFDSERYPAEGEAEDDKAGLLADAGKALPLIDRVVFTLEKETIPYWNKFLQGYFDASGISSDSFDQAVQVSVGGETSVSDEMREQGITLSTSVAISTMYTGFNWLDPVVGGSSERARKLRQAIAIAVDFEEFVSIFANGRGISAQSPIPPGIFGYLEGEAGINKLVYDWAGGQAVRKPIAEARRLLAEAGYPDGVDINTHQPLVINLDTTATGVGNKSRLDWMRKQFEKLNVQLVVRSTDYNRFQDKVRRGDTQMFYFGWNADYPDPENFLFLLHGPQGKVSYSGENAANYSNPDYDRLFLKMKNMENSPARQAIIDQMLEILRRDSPWLWGYHPKNYVLQHGWLHNVKPSVMANNKLKYWRLDAKSRDALRARWNQPSRWPLWSALVLVLLSGFWLWRVLQKKEACSR